MKIDRVSGNVTFFDFLENYLLPNRPCIIDRELCDDWEAVKLWQQNGLPNFSYLHQQFGEFDTNSISGAYLESQVE